MNVSSPGTDLRTPTSSQRLAEAIKAIAGRESERVRRVRVNRFNAEIKRDLDQGRI